LLRKLLEPSMLLVEMADPLLGRRRSAVLIATGVGFTLGVGVVLLLSAILQRSCASVEVGCPAVLAVRRFFLQDVLIAVLIKHDTRIAHCMRDRRFDEGAAATTAGSAAFHDQSATIVTPVQNARPGRDTRGRIGNPLTFSCGSLGQRTVQVSQCYKIESGPNMAEEAGTYLDIIPATVSTGSALDDIAADLSCPARNAGTSCTALGDLGRLVRIGGW
jgi:hypothetical protein